MRAARVHRGQFVTLIVAVLVGLLAAVFGTPQPASAAVGPENRVRASTEIFEPIVGPPQHVSAAQDRVSGVPGYEIVVAIGVAANTAGKTCKFNSFTADTLVLTAEGSKKPIEDVKLGDLVMAKNPITGLIGPRKVIDLIRHAGPHTIVKVRLADGTVIDATDEHPSWVESEKAWVDAIDLKPGDVLVEADGDMNLVFATLVTEQNLIAYNLTVEDLHTFFVGDEPVLVHNDGGPDFTIAGDYAGRIDPFNYRRQAYFEVHVYYKGTEVGIYGSNGWIGKHGHSADMRLNDQVENRLKGIAIDEMRRSGRLGPNDSIKGDSWKRPHIGDVC